MGWGWVGGRGIGWVGSKTPSTDSPWQKTKPTYSFPCATVGRIAIGHHKLHHRLSSNHYRPSVHAGDPPPPSFT